MIRARPVGPGLPVPAWTLTVAAMASVQLGAALSLGLIDALGPAGTAWLRLSAGAVILLLLVRPKRTVVTRTRLAVLVPLGLCTAAQTTTFLAAIERLPLGTAVAIEFLGPLVLAGVHARRRSALLWPVLAFLGVLLLTEPWRGDVNLPGIALAAVAAAGWAGYIELTRHAGARVEGIGALAITVPVAALATAVIGVPQAAGHVGLREVVVAVGLALLLPVLPFVAELLALRSLSPTAFGTLMALEPAFGVLVGAVVLHQTPGVPAVVGTGIVVLAGAAAQRSEVVPDAPSPVEVSRS